MYLFSWLQGSTLRYLKHFHNQTGGTLVPTSPQRESLMKDGFRNVQLLARGVDCELFHPRNRSDELREQWGVKQDDVVMLFVGRLAVEKNLSLLMRTYKELRATSEGKRLKLVMVGDGPLRQKLERKYPSVTFCGKQLGTSLAQHYASADIFAFPSLSETFGNVITEAMASGLAVVGFDYAATQMHIRHYVSGMAIECDKPEEFSAALNELIISPALRGRLSVQARKHVETISWQTVVNQFYQYLLALKAQQCDIPQQALRKWV